MTTKMVFVIFVSLSCVCLTTWAGIGDFSIRRVKRGGGYGAYGGGPGAGGGARGPVYLCGFAGSKEGNIVMWPGRHGRQRDQGWIPKATEIKASSDKVERESNKTKTVEKKSELPTVKSRRQLNEAFLL